MATPEQMFTHTLCEKRRYAWITETRERSFSCYIVAVAEERTVRLFCLSFKLRLALSADEWYTHNDASGRSGGDTVCCLRQAHSVFGGGSCSASAAAAFGGCEMHQAQFMRASNSGARVLRVCFSVPGGRLTIAEPSRLGLPRPFGMAVSKITGIALLASETVSAAAFLDPR